MNPAPPVMTVLKTVLLRKIWDATDKRDQPAVTEPSYRQQVRAETRKNPHEEGVSAERSHHRCRKF